MSRLTFKHRDFYLSQAPCTDDLALKLGKLEDIEDELGCPLEVREKTLHSFYCPELENKKQIIKCYGYNYSYNDEKLIHYYVYAFNSEELFIKLIYDYYDEIHNEETTVPLKDYKKTWWLKEDLSE